MLILNFLRRRVKKVAQSSAAMVSLGMVTYPIITINQLIEAYEYNGSVVACPNTPWCKLTERYDHPRVEDCARVLTLDTFSDYCFDGNVNDAINHLARRLW